MAISSPRVSRGSSAGAAERSLRASIDHAAPVLLALREPWTCALLRAELAQRGHEAARAARVAAALLAPERMRTVRALVVDQGMLSERDCLVLEWLRDLDAAPAIVLLTGASLPGASPHADRVLRRPITIGTIAEVADGLIRAGSAPNRAAQPSTEFFPLRGFAVRLGPPWPMIQCGRCAATRHCDTPRTPADRERVRVALVKFGLGHESCPASSHRRLVSARLGHEP